MHCVYLNAVSISLVGEGDPHLKNVISCSQCETTSSLLPHWISNFKSSFLNTVTFKCTVFTNQEVCITDQLVAVTTTTKIIKK